jgi:hypothetical protein
LLEQERDSRSETLATQLFKQYHLPVMAGGLISVEYIREAA